MVTKAPLNKARASLALHASPADLLTICGQDLSRSLHTLLKDNIEKATVLTSTPRAGSHHLETPLWSLGGKGVNS